MLLAVSVMAQNRLGQHPGYQLVSYPLDDFNMGITGMDFLPDGRMVISTYRGDTAKSYENIMFGRETFGQVYLVENIQGDPSEVTHSLIADGFIDAMGVEVVEGDIYIGDINRIIKLVDSDGDGFYENKETVGELPAGDDASLTYSYGPVYKDGYFYMSLGSPAAFNSKDRGTVVRIPFEGGDYEVVATGLRSPDGIGLGPEGEIFVTDNQGNFRPASILTHIQPGKFYGWGFGNNQPETASPSLHLPYQVLNNSPTEPAYMSNGRYAGQILYGDWGRNTLFRAFVEQVGGNYQGAAFPVTGGFSAFVHRIKIDDDGVIYLGEITLASGPRGPQKLIPRPEAQVFEMLAVRSRLGGMEIEFTQPVGDAAEQVEMYALEHWHYTPTSAYYNDPQDVLSLEIASVQISEDRLRVYLEVPGLSEGKVIHISLGENYTSQTGENLWFQDTYYTLNAISNTPPQLASISPSARETASYLKFERKGKGLMFHWKGNFENFSLYNLQGALRFSSEVSDQQTLWVPASFLTKDVLIVKLTAENIYSIQKIIL